ncbi:MAG: hypothetical protein K6F52_04690 [Clostridia bacterium]|nr:hypothetical protein [Clostridia bacterium]
MVLFGIIVILAIAMVFFKAIPGIFWDYIHGKMLDLISYFYIDHFFEFKDLPYDELIHKVQDRYNLSYEKAEKLFKEASDYITIEKKSCNQFTCLLKQD